MLNKLIHLFILGVCLQAVAFSQPTGGPYGPVQSMYIIPEHTVRVIYVATDAKPENAGTDIGSPTTIEKAIENSISGDVIVLRGGTYRTGNLLINQGITIQPYRNEQPVFKGSYIADKWKNLGNGLWTTHWNILFPSKPDGWWQRDHEGKKTPLYKFNNDMVFVDGRFLQTVGWEGEVNQDSYYIDYESGLVYIGTDPANHLVEITAFNSAITRTVKEINGKKSDGRGPVIKGITFTHYAYRAFEIEGREPEEVLNESHYGKDVIGTILENCTITHCSRVAGYFRGDSLIIRNCKISHTSTEGLYIIASNDVLLENNIFTQNNIEEITGYYPAAVKIFNQCHRVTCKNNLVIDLPNSNGIWYDVGNVDGVFINNWVQNVGRSDKTMPVNQVWPSDNGFFFEISKGLICAGNVFVNCDHGMMILNSSNAQVYNNTFVNSPACFGRNGRVPEGDHFGWHSSAGPGVDERDGHVFVNNLLTASNAHNRPMLLVWQPETLCEKLNKSQLKLYDNNLYVRKGESSTLPIIIWSPDKGEKCQGIYNSISDFCRSLSGFGKMNIYLNGYNGPLFKCEELNNYDTAKGLESAANGTEIPDYIAKLAGFAGNSRFIGAWPAKDK